jgi:hypothetical protein
MLLAEYEGYHIALSVLRVSVSLRVSSFRLYELEPVEVLHQVPEQPFFLQSGTQGKQVIYQELDRHTTPKTTLELYAQTVSADQQKAHRKVVRMVLPLKFPDKLRAASAAATVKDY